MSDRRRGPPAGQWQNNADAPQVRGEGPTRDRRIASRRLAPWMEPRVHPVPPKYWKSFGQKRWPRNQCRVCGVGIWDRDHGRCNISLREALVEGTERTLDELDRVIAAPPNPPADDPIA